MSDSTSWPVRVCRRAALAVSLAGMALLVGCAVLPGFLGGQRVERPQPAELPPNPALIGVSQAWAVRLPAVDFPLVVPATGGSVVVATGDGTVVSIDAATGREAWRASVGGPVAAGVGSDGRLAAVVTRENELVAISAGQVAWRAAVGAQVFTPPLVAGGRVFVLAGDRSVSAYDGTTGRRLWVQQRPGDPLVLRQSGVLLAVGNTLVAGQGGRLVGLDPRNGSPRWEAAIATPRGTNDIERLVDLVGPVSREDNSLCVRAYQAAVGCVDAARGTVQWTRPAGGAEGLGGDERRVFGVEGDGRLLAWRRADGERDWVNTTLQWRSLLAPVPVGRSIAVGDGNGFVHLLSREDGSLNNRLATDGSAVAAAPVLSGNTLVVVTRSGGVFGFVPQ
jgi:outer membrane protein assembly factor BamB